METALVVQQQLTPDTWKMIEAVAPTMHLARCFGVSSKEQAAAIMLKGYELGLSLSGSFEFIHIIQGKPALSPRGALALIMQSPLNGGIKIEDGKDKCTVWMKRADNDFEYTVTWTMEDTKRAGIIKDGGGWTTYPANMLRWRTVGFCADVVFPDLTGGMKRADEYGADLTPEGDVLEGSWSVVNSQPTPANGGAPTVEDPATDAITLDSLVNAYGAEAVMAANNGKIPDTDEDILIVATALGWVTNS